MIMSISSILILGTLGILINANLTLHCVRESDGSDVYGSL